jgi:hypothetical protein
MEGGVTRPLSLCICMALGSLHVYLALNQDNHDTRKFSQDIIRFHSSEFRYSL